MPASAQLATATATDDQPGFDAARYLRKVLRLVHGMLPDDVRARALQAGMDPLPQLRCRHRLQGLSRPAAIVSGLSLWLAHGALYGAGFEAGKMPRGILSTGPAHHGGQLRSRLARCLARPPCDGHPAPIGEDIRRSDRVGAG